MISKHFKKTIISGLALAAMTVVPAMAAPIVFTGSSGSLAASASFEVSGTNLIVTLTNTSASDVGVPADILTGVFFDISGAGALTPVSAILGAGSTVFFDADGQPAGGNVGGEWAYASGLAGAPGGATEGISSAGFGLFGSGNFNGPDLDSPAAVNGMNYGLLSAGDDTTVGNPAVTGNNPLAKNEVVFSLSGLGAGFDLTNNILNVSFQYGTDLTEPNVPGNPGNPPCLPGDTSCCIPGEPGCNPGGNIPEPETLAIFASGLIALGVVTRRRRKKA